MNLTRLVFKELWLRKSQLISGLLTIMLGIAVIVSIHAISTESEKAVAIKLDNLGANILVLPQAASVDDYYSADIDAPTFPEEYVEILTTSMLPGIDNLSPKLTRRIMIGGENIVLTGILPKNEIASKPVWQQNGILGEQAQASCAPSANTEPLKYKDERLQRKGIDDLAGKDCFVGTTVARKLSLSEGDTINIEGSVFQVVKVLPETGTVDDARVFANLHEVQTLLGINGQVSAIEIMGCCNEISQGLLGKLRNILPDTRITTINQIVATQIETNQMMRRLSIAFLLIIIVVGGISIANCIWANVNERRREIGILRMIGYHKHHIFAILLAKAAIMGSVGGLLGYLLGLAAAMYFGPLFIGIPVATQPYLLILAVGLAVLIAIVGALLPAWKAGKLEPFLTMQET